MSAHERRFEGMGEKIWWTLRFAHLIARGVDDAIGGRGGDVRADANERSEGNAREHAVHDQKLLAHGETAEPILGRRLLDLGRVRGLRGLHRRRHGNGDLGGGGHVGDVVLRRGVVRKAGCSQGGLQSAPLRCGIVGETTRKVRKRP